MTPEIQRLGAWMKNHGYDSASLSSALCYSSDFIKTIVEGERGIYRGLKMRFCAVFGLRQYESVFGASSPAFHFNSQQRMAHVMVTNAIHSGELPHQSAFKCHGCVKQASQYHHPSYRPKDRLCVIPLCRGCHRCHETGKRLLAFGVVPTSVGLVRIAIATTTLTTQ